MNPNSHPRFTNILFTSLSQFTNSSSLFPTHDRRIGLTVSCGYHPEHRCVMVEIEEEQPSFISTSIGEYVSPDTAELTVRQKCRELADMCRSQAKELMEHANRLDLLSTQNLPIIDHSKIDKDSDHEVIYLPKKEKREVSTYRPPATKISHSLDMGDI